MRKMHGMCKIVGVQLQCVNNHYHKFEYKGIKTFGVTDNTLGTPKVLRTDMLHVGTSLSGDCGYHHLVLQLLCVVFKVRKGAKSKPF